MRRLSASTSARRPARLGSGVNSEVAITRALIELDVEARPEATNFSGTLLSRGAGGAADLVFDASDPGATGGFGPGVYAVTAQIDGRTVYSGVPDTTTGPASRSAPTRRPGG